MQVTIINDWVEYDMFIDVVDIFSTHAKHLLIQQHHDMFKLWALDKNIKYDFRPTLLCIHLLRLTLRSFVAGVVVHCAWGTLVRLLRFFLIGLSQFHDRRRRIWPLVTALRRGCFSGRWRHLHVLTCDPPNLGWFPLLAGAFFRHDKPKYQILGSQSVSENEKYNLITMVSQGVCSRINSIQYMVNDYCLCKSA